MFKAILQKMNIDEGNTQNPETPAADAAAPAQSDAPAPAPAAGGAVDTAKLEADIIERLKTVYDPEIPVNIYEMGLIYELKVEPDGMVHVKMTLTSPACPVAGTLPGEVEAKVRNTPGVTNARVELVWEPAWNLTMMTEAARLQLNLM